MTNSKKVILSILLILIIIALSVITVVAQTIYVSGGYSYTALNDDYIALCNWDGGSDTLVIPERIDYSKVKEISNRAFYGRDDFNSVDFSDATYLDYIGMMAFSNCTALSGTLDLTPGIKRLGIGAFQGCTGIETLYFNAGTESITSQSFYDCDGLSAVYINDGVKKIESLAFGSCDNLTIVRIPETIIEINAYAFDSSPDVVIYCYTDSYAHQYAVDNGIDYVLIDAPTPTEPTVATEPTVPTEPTAVTEATVPTETAATEPSVATEPPTTAPVSYILGDVDNSGNVDVVDATFAQRYTIHASIPDEILDGIVMRADVDNTGELDSADVTFIMRHLIRVKTPYPIGETVSRII